MIGKMKKDFPDCSALLLLVGAGIMAEGYLLAAQRRNLHVAVVESEDRLQELCSRFSCIVDAEPIYADEVVDEAWILPTMRLARRTCPAAILAFAEPHVLAASVAQDTLGLSGPGIFAAVVSRNKAMQRSIFASIDLEQPLWKVVGSIENAQGWAHENFPVVIKPLSGMGSAGVECFNGVTSWNSIVQRRLMEKPLLVERYVNGEEYSVEALVFKGSILFLNLTKKVTTGPTSFVEIAHVVGYAEEDPELAALARKLVERVVEVVRLGTSIVHLEFKQRDDGTLAVMEVAFRTPGDHIFELSSIAYGVDLYDVVIDLAFGYERPDLAVIERKMLTGIQYVNSASEGIVRDFDFSKWVQIEGVRRHYIMAKVGDRVSPPYSSNDRLGYIILVHSDIVSLKLAMRRALEAFKVFLE